MQIVSSLLDNLHEIQNRCLGKNEKKKLFQNVVCWIFYPEC